MTRRDWNVNSLENYILGTAGLGGVWGKVDAADSIDVILNALEGGVQSIDTAPAYGDGEWFVGEALQQWTGAPPRISTKVGRLKSYTADQGIYDYTPEGMTKSVEQSLKALKVPAIDVLFLHEPGAIPAKEVQPAIEKMIELKQNGVAIKIGLGGNYPSSFFQYLKAGVFDVVMEYNRLNLCCIDALNTTLPECESLDIEYWAASPLHMGLLGRQFASFIQSKPDWLDQHFIDIALGVDKMATEYHLTLPSLALRFLQNIPFPIQIVTGPVNQNELNDTFSAFRQGRLDEILYKELIDLIKETKR